MSRFEVAEPSNEVERAGRAITKGRASLIVDNVFFGTLALNLKPVPTYERKTLATDGVGLFYNPAYVLKLPAPKLRGVLAHEVLHVALNHHTRRGGRDPKEWNISADFAINAILKKEGFDLPEGALIDPQYDGLSAEQIYARRRQQQQQDQGAGQDPNQQQQPGQNGAGQGQPDPNGQPGQPQPGAGQPGAGGNDETGCGEVLDAPAPDGAGAGDEPDQHAAEQRQNVQVVQALHAAEGAGKVPGFAKRIVEEILNPKRAPKDLLRDFVQRTRPTEVTWDRPNRRLIGSGIYLPSRGGKQGGLLEVGLDTSGSVDDATLQLFLGWLNEVLEDAPFEKVRVTYCDSAVQGTDVFEDGEPIKAFTNAAGGGGTKFAPVFEAVEEYGEEPDALIYLTDLDGYGQNCFPRKAPDYPVLWCTTLKTAAPFGEIVRIET